MNTRQNAPAPAAAPSGVRENGTRRPRRRRVIAIALAGPTLIVVSVLVVMHGFWLFPRLTNQQLDLLSFWLPRWCAMGKTVAAGHIPTWLPNQFGGVPFASDPQSGWLYAPVMLLFGTMPCATAFGWLIALQPALAGLGLYAFFRNEGTGRVAATAGGLTLGLAMAGSQVALSMPFSGMLTWTAIALAGASGFLHARTRAGHVGWLAFTGFAWSQIAAAHLTNGLLFGSATVGLYVVARLATEIRAGRRTFRVAGAEALGMAVALPVLGAAVLVPRLALLPRTSIGHGYVALGALTQQLSHLGSVPPSALYPLNVHGIGPWWGTAFARGPGGYIGALAILLLPMAFLHRRWRLPAIGFALLGFLGWLANLDGLIRSGPIREFAIQHGLGELWLRSPYRFRYLLVLSLAVLAGYGLQAWLDTAKAMDRRALARRALWFVPGIVVFVVAPLMAGASAGHYVLFAIGAALLIPLLVLAASGRGWAATAIPVAVAVELVIAGLAGQTGPIPVVSADNPQQPSSPGLGVSFPTFHDPWIPPSELTVPGPIGRTMLESVSDHGRFVSYSPKIARGSIRGFLLHQTPGVLPAYANDRATLLGLDDVQGYSPVQLFRYWELVRRVDTAAPIYYNSSTLQAIPPQVLKLFGIEWIVQPSASPAPPNAAAVTTEGSWTLYQYLPWESRASVVGQWSRVMPPEQALEEVVRPGFDPARFAVIERPVTVNGRPIAPPQPPIFGLPPGTQPYQQPIGSATYTELSPEHVRVRVTSRAPALLVVRNPWDTNWHATVDGRPVPLQVADFVMQGVGVPAGTHTVELTYRDPAVAYGVWISVGGYLVLLVLGLVWRRRDRRGSPGDPAPGGMDQGAGNDDSAIAAASR